MKHPGKTLISASRIQKRIHQLAAQITHHYQGQPLTVVGLMNGSLFFLVDLLRLLPPETQVECWKLKSYRGTRSTGKIQGLDSCHGDYHGRHVLIVDDILDTGLTLQEVTKKIQSLKAASVLTCVLLDKKDTRTKKISAHWVGFTIPPLFVIGYGLDLNHQYRTLPMIRVLSQTKN
jgi:hypoxanthine phosphoribosyltransferase